MNEHARMKQFEAGLGTQGFLAHVLPDQAHGTVKPCDMIACGPQGRFWAVEGKAVQVPSWSSQQTLLGPRSFRAHQIPSLLHFARSEAVASVVLFVAPPQARDTRAWLLDVRGVACLLAQDGVLRLQNIDEGEAAPWELRRLPEGRWGLKDELRRWWHEGSNEVLLAGWTLRSAVAGESSQPE